MSITNVLALLGGVALFLFGMSLMIDGLKKVAGSKLELVLYRLSSNSLKGILLGTGYEKNMSTPLKFLEDIRERCGI